MHQGHLEAAVKQIITEVNEHAVKKDKRRLPCQDELETCQV